MKTASSGPLLASSADRARHIVGAAALSLLLLALWSLTHRYHGFARDGELYAVQAMARIHPALGADVYLQNVSQDRFTVFSPIYAAFIKIFGLQTAEMVLFIVCTAWFLAAAGALARKFAGEQQAWLAVGLLIITVGYYGAYQIFSYSENYLTARSAGQALVATAIACYFYGWKALSFAVAALAMLVHPLMALPGLLLLICLTLPTRWALLSAVGGLAGALGLAILAGILPTDLRFALVMEPQWLHIVRERSQFLFFEHWAAIDWEAFALPFVCLVLTALVIRDHRVFKLCAMAMLVGASGMVLAWIGSSLAPLTVVLQGQAWRWMWVTNFVSVVLLVPTMFTAWRDKKCGPLCSLLLVLAWTYPGLDGLASADAALLLWLIRTHISILLSRYLRWGTAGLAAVVLVWALASCWSFAWGPIAETGRESLAIARIREMFGLGVSAALVTGLCWYAITASRSVWTRALSAIALLAIAGAVLPGSMKQLDTVGTPQEFAEFADWRNAIGPRSNVLVVPTRKSASFTWFTLQRPNYSSADQSSGVVFSRATALEIRRRSEVLLPLADPDWQILSQINAERDARLHGQKPPEIAARPLTQDTLMSVCTDPQLGFVIAKETVGFQPLRHTHVDAWKDWNLYDCRQVRLAPPA